MVAENKRRCKLMMLEQLKEWNKHIKLAFDALSIERTCSIKSLRSVCCTPFNADATAYAYLSATRHVSNIKNQDQKTSLKNP